jgi:Fanconi anemia group M protein
MLKLYSEYNIQLIQSSDPIETSAILLKLAEREQVVDGRMPRIAGVKKAYTTFQWQTMMLGSLPGIGPNLALRLLSNFKTLKNIANADINSLMKVDKIGKKKASRIYGILNAEFEMS